MEPFILTIALEIKIESNLINILSTIRGISELVSSMCNSLKRFSIVKSPIDKRNKLLFKNKLEGLILFKKLKLYNSKIFFF